MEEIAPDIFIETHYPPYNLGLLTTDGGAIAVDMPPNPLQAREWLDQIQETVGKLRYVVITDAIPERQVAAAACRCPLIATEVTLRHIAKHEEREWRELLEDVAEKYPEAAKEIMALQPNRVKLAFNPTYTLHTSHGALNFETVTGPAPGALWLTIPEQNLLFAGDSIILEQPALLHYAEDSKAWLEALGKLLRRSSTRKIIPGRGKAPILRGDIEKQREFFRTMRRTARRLARQGQEDLSYQQSAQDLGQTFFNQGGQKAVKQIRQGLVQLVAEIQSAQQEDEEEKED